MLDTYVTIQGITALLLQTIGKISDKTRSQCKCAGGVGGTAGDGFKIPLFVNV